MTKLRRATVFPPLDLLIAPVPFGRAREMGSLEEASWSSSPRPRPGLCPAELPGNPGGGPPAPGRVFRERVEQAQRAQRARLDTADLPAYRHAGSPTRASPGPRGQRADRVQEPPLPRRAFARAAPYRRNGHGRGLPSARWSSTLPSLCGPTTRRRWPGTRRRSRNRRNEPSVEPCSGG